MKNVYSRCTRVYENISSIRRYVNIVFEIRGYFFVLSRANEIVLLRRLYGGVST